MDEQYLRRLTDRIGAAYPGQRLDLSVEQTSHDHIEGRYVVRWRVRPSPDIFIVQKIEHPKPVVHLFPPPSTPRR